MHEFQISNLIYPDVIETYNDFFQIEKDISRVKFDISKMKRVEPFAMLIFINRIEEFKKEYPNVTRSITGFDKDIPAHSYANFVGFFESFGCDTKIPSSNYSTGKTYFKITEYNKKMLAENTHKENLGVVQKYLELESEKITGLICGGNDEIYNSVFKCVLEVLRNAYEHSETDRFWIAGQKYHNKIEIAVLDEGVGIKQALSFNHSLEKIVNNPTTEDYLKLALESAISGKTFKHLGEMRYGNYDIGNWVNSGFGLHINSEIKSGYGEFVICSKDTLLKKALNNEEIVDFKIKGTALRLVFYLDKINNLNQSKIDEIIINGQNKAEKLYSEYTDTKASSASKKSLSL